MSFDGSTIVAIATPPGQGGIGVIRMSGSEAATLALRVFRMGRTAGEPAFNPENSHRVFYGRVIKPEDLATIDEVMLTWMAAPRTYTREDTVEISCHGGMVPVAEILRLLIRLGARAAEPGEFTLRAFLNGRLDLSQAEAVLNVVSARSSEGLRLAVDDLAGGLTRRLKPAQNAVVSLLAYLDAAADFPDDEIQTVDVDAELSQALGALEDVLAGSRAGSLYRDGVQIALVGKPNVGKSSLLNALLRSDRAIVTPIAGTTRDVIAESFSLRGIPATLLDTAGIAESSDLIEQLGIERSRKALAASAVVILVLDGSQAPDGDDLAVARSLRDRAENSGEIPVVIAMNKADIASDMDQRAVTGLLPGASAVRISAREQIGIAELESALHTLLTRDAESLARPAMISARQHAALDRALDHLRAAHAARADGYPIDLLATDVRAALHAIGQVTGEAVDEAVLTEIFSRFCIGK